MTDEQPPFKPVTHTLPLASGSSMTKYNPGLLKMFLFCSSLILFWGGAGDRTHR